MLARLQIHAGAIAAAFRQHRHVLVILPAAQVPAGRGEAESALRGLLARRRLKPRDLLKKPLC